MSVTELDSVMETQVAQLNLLLYQIYRPYFNGKIISYFILFKVDKILCLSLRIHIVYIFRDRKECCSR